MIKTRGFGLLLAIVLVISGCSGGSSSKSEDEITDPSTSEVSTIGIEENEKGTYLKINKKALDKEYLLQGSLAFQKDFGYHVSNPTSKGLKSRIVKFEEQGDQVVMLDVSGSTAPGDELEAHILLASFPIIERTENILIFDFNTGMKDAIIAWDWYASDFYGNALSPDFTFTISNSYIREAVDLKGALSLKQNFSAKYYGMSLPIEITHYISEYTKSASFKSTDSPGFDYLGFFEVNPIAQKDFGLGYTKISKWDTNKPIVYYVSNDFPEKYKDAVIKGVLYWNKAFGKEIVQAKIAPAEVKAPDFEHNIIQWHTDHYSGAYADAQMDPRTGEILHSQIFISSAFTEWAKASTLPKLERDLELDGLDELSTHHHDDASEDNVILNAKQINESSLCNLKVHELFATMYKHRNTIAKLPSERIDQLTNYILTAVVAHEVGHTMGLRHNFAGSTADKTNSETRKKAFREFLTTGTLPEGFTPPTNSIMDYMGSTNDMLIGAFIADPSKPALDHDKYAINWAYFENSEKPKYEGHPFCTDSGVYSFIDCMVWDEGAHLLETYTDNTISSLNNIPKLLAENYLSAKINFNPRFRKPVKEATPSSWYLASSVIYPFYDLMMTLSSNFNLKNILLNYPDYTDIDSDNYELDILNWVNSEIEFTGGTEEVLKIIDPLTFRNTFEAFPSEFKRIINSDTYKNASLPEGGSATFTADEIAYMTNRANKLIPEIEDNIAYATIVILGRGKMKLLDTVDIIEKKVANWAGFIVTYANGLDFHYSYDTRRTAAQLLIRANGPFSDWMENYIPPIADKLKQKLETGFGSPIEDIDIESFPRAEREKVADELAIYKMLSAYGSDPAIIMPSEDSDEDSDATALDIN